MPAYRTDPADELRGTLSALESGTPAAAVAARLLTYFTEGGVSPGTRLPPERQLAQMLATGRSAVREALAALEILGIVDVRPGSGTYLRSDVSELLPRTLSWGVMLGDRSTRDLVQIRSSLEVLAAGLAAAHVDADGLARLRSHLEQMEAHRAGYPAFVEADLHFHQEVAAASGNETLSGLLQSVRSLLRVWMDRSISHDQEASDAIVEHARLLQALTEHDVAAARSAMEEHMRTAAGRLLGLVADPDGTGSGAADPA